MAVSTGEEETPRARRRALWMVLLLGGALVVLVVLAAPKLLRRAPEKPPPEPLAHVKLLTPRGDLDAPPTRFSWEPIAGARQYSVKISDADAIWPLFVRTTESNSLVLDPAQTAAFLPGRFHVWEVEALDEKGVPVAHGGTSFRIKAAGGQGSGLS